MHVCTFASLYVFAHLLTGRTLCFAACQPSKHWHKCASSPQGTLHQHSASMRCSATQAAGTPCHCELALLVTSLQLGSVGHYLFVRQDRVAMSLFAPTVVKCSPSSEDVTSSTDKENDMICRRSQEMCSEEIQQQCGCSVCH